ncbi:MAG: hypothetical protein AMJ93_11520 [Anaerolineae bacterium SM23_84]|nr:MAG: hypothetical protein AMJ93_11520 [Anaerolineae bacterium SM23_84]
MMPLESGSEPKERNRWQGASVVALIASVGMVIGCFLPWQQAEGTFSDPGIATLEGSIALFAALLVGGVALYSLGTRRVAFRNLFFLLIGIGGLSVGTMNLRLGSVWARVLDIGASSLVGSGVYVIMGSAALMVMAGFVGYLGSYSASAQTNKGPSALGKLGTYQMERSSPIATSTVRAVKTRRKVGRDPNGLGVGNIPGLKQSFKKHWHIYICGATGLGIVIEILFWAFRYFRW